MIERPEREQERQPERESRNVRTSNQANRQLNRNETYRLPQNDTLVTITQTVCMCARACTRARVCVCVLFNEDLSYVSTKLLLMMKNTFPLPNSHSLSATPFFSCSYSFSVNAPNPCNVYLSSLSIFSNEAVEAPSSTNALGFHFHPSIWLLICSRSVSLIRSKGWLMWYDFTLHGCVHICVGV